MKVRGRALHNTYDQLLIHLDGIGVMLELAHETVFDHIQEDSFASIWLIGRNFPESFDLYKRQITHGALILGYSYLEVYLGDLARLIYHKHPQKIPPKKTITYKEILDNQDSGGIQTYLIEREVRSVFSGSMKDILKYFKDNLDISAGQSLDDSICEVSLLRNCLVHAGDVVSSELAIQFPKFQKDQPIALSVTDIHRYGLTVREFAKAFWEHGHSKKFW
jgi:hypothetical protein